MKRTVQIKNLNIGSGMPKICVPITGVTETEILAQAVAIKEASPDLVEWRVDFFAQREEEKAVEKILSALAEILQGIQIGRAHV